MKTIDALSISIISNTHPVAYQSVGVILNIPKQNVLLASITDFMFENNIGLIDRVDNMVNISSPAETLTKLTEMPAVKRTSLLIKAIKNSLHLMDTPDNILNGGHPSCHTEVVITGKPNVNIHANFPATKECNISGIFLMQAEPTSAQLYNADFEKKEVLSKEDQLSIFLKNAPSIASKLNVPLIFIDEKYWVTPKK